MKRATTCSIRLYRVSYLKKIILINMLQQFLMCAMVFAIMISENFEAMLLQKWLLRKCGNTIFSVSSLDTSTAHILLIREKSYLISYSYKWQKFPPLTSSCIVKKISGTGTFSDLSL
jgi:hypothetical protein